MKELKGVSGVESTGYKCPAATHGPGINEKGLVCAYDATMCQRYGRGCVVVSKDNPHLGDSRASNRRNEQVRHVMLHTASQHGEG